MKLATVIFTVLLLAGCQDADAAKIVKDPWNLARNAVTAAQAAKQTALQTQQLQTQVNQYSTMLRNIQRLPDPALSHAVLGRVPTSVADAQGGALDLIQRYSQASRALMTLSGDYTRIDDTVKTLMRVSANSNLDYQKILESEVAMRQLGRQSETRFLDLFSSIGQDIEHNKTRADQIIQQLPKNQGLMQAVSTINVQNALLSDQLGQLIATTNARNVRDTRKEIEQMDAEERDRLKRERWERAKAEHRKMIGLD